MPFCPWVFFVSERRSKHHVDKVLLNHFDEPLQNDENLSIKEKIYSKHKGMLPPSKSPRYPPKSAMKLVIVYALTSVLIDISFCEKVDCYKFFVHMYLYIRITKPCLT